MKRQTQYEHQLLVQIEGGQHVSQRSLSTSLGIALGLTNLLVRSLVKKGWVRATRIRPNRVSYLLTPAGIAEKARLSRLYLQNSVQFYSEARDRIGKSLALLSNEWPSDGSAPQKRVVFYGAGEVAEIAYICMQATDLELVAVIAESRTQSFFGRPVYSGADLREGFVGETQFERIVVASFEEHNAVRCELEKFGVSEGRVCWL